MDLSKLVLSKRAVCILLECFLANNISYLFVTVRNEVAKVMFLHVSVCPQGGVPGQLPPDQVHPHNPLWDQVQPPGTGIPPDQVHPPHSETRYTPLEPGTHPRDQVYPPGQVPPKETATVADGTHPTGIHSCSQIFSRV